MYPSIGGMEPPAGQKTAAHTDPNGQKFKCYALRDSYHGTQGANTPLS